MKKTLKNTLIASSASAFVAAALFFASAPSDAAFTSTQACVDIWETNTSFSFSQDVIPFTTGTGQAISIAGTPLLVYLSQDSAPSDAPSFSGVTLDPASGNLTGEAYFPYLESIIRFEEISGNNVATISALESIENQILSGYLNKTIDLSAVDITANGSGEYNVAGNGVHSDDQNIGFGNLSLDGLSLSTNSNITEECKEEIVLKVGNEASGTWYSDYVGSCAYNVNISWASQNVVDCVAESGPWPTSMLGNNIDDSGVIDSRNINESTHVKISCTGGYSNSTLTQLVPMSCEQEVDCAVSPYSETPFCICQGDADNPATDPTNLVCKDSLGNFIYQEI